MTTVAIFEKALIVGLEANLWNRLATAALLDAQMDRSAQDKHAATDPV